MDIKTANRLMELRKAHGFSQEELADKLGISRQAVSKWERAESSPDTDNLIELAKLYGISLDDMLFSDDVNVSKEEATETNKQSKLVINDDEITLTTDDNTVIHYSKSRFEKKKRVEEVFKFLSPIYALLIVITYLIIGFTITDYSGFGHFWFLFITIPVFDSLKKVFVKQSISDFNFACLITTIFCAIGMLADVWHPTWVVFILIPVLYMVANAFDKIIPQDRYYEVKKAYNKENGSAYEDDDDDD